MKRITAVFLAALLVGCGTQDEPAVPDEAKSAKSEKKAPVQQSGAAALQASGRATPNEDRIATLGLLNKRDNRSQDIVLKTGESRRAGNVIVKLASCERTAPWETVQDTGAFVQVFIEEAPAPGEDVKWRKVFSGWLFKNAPALNVLEHPVYDVWVKDCAMKFPGDEPLPAASASAKSATKAFGNGNGASASASE